MAKQNYHHGELREALIFHAAQVLDETGVANFSLREVARRAGVSHAAPGHHFESKYDLMDKVAVAGFTKLTGAMIAAVAEVSSPKERLIESGKAYYKTAVENPGYFSVMFSGDGHSSEESHTAGSECYGFLLTTVAAVLEEAESDMCLSTAASLVWSTVHGYANLSEMWSSPPPGQPTPDIDELLDTALGALVNGIVSTT